MGKERGGGREGGQRDERGMRKRSGKDNVS